jgi:anti-sigma regulatory factor (Ser/Thr protein kinase)
MVSDSVVGEFSLSLDPDAEAARHARDATMLSLHEWDMKELLDDATLVVSELVTNAAKLGQSFELRLTANGRTLRIEVGDHSVDEPIVKTRVGDDRAEDGRGLLVVDALADLWGFDVRTDGGKIVWAVLTCP